MKKFKPTQYMIDWAKNLVDITKDGGMWQVQSTGNKYIIDKSNKQIVLIEGEIDDIHDKNKIVFPLIGYGVKDDLSLKVNKEKRFAKGQQRIKGE